MAGEPKRILVIHLGLALAEAICISAFYVELRRALGGNSLSWAYVFEWPLFAGYAVYMWRRLLNEERHTSRRPTSNPSSTAVDPRLDAYNDYLESVHRDDATGRD